MSSSPSESGFTSSGSFANGQVQPTGTEGVSFWEIGAYKKCLDRMDYGYKMANLLIEMVEDRGKIEAQYAKSLRHFSEKWQKVVESGIVYGAHKQAWLGVSLEAESTAALHNSLAEKLSDRDSTSAISLIKGWQKQAYHRNTLTGALKETKDLEAMFQRAQRAYSKRFTKVEETRRTYHKAAAALRVSEQRVEQSKVDGSTEAATRSKQDKLTRCEIEAIQARELYHASLRDIDIIKGDYVDKMTQAFSVAQEFERSRLTFIAELLTKLSSILDRGEWSTSVAAIADAQRERVTSAQTNVNSDLLWFSEAFGADSPCTWQEFEEYDPTATIAAATNVTRSSTMPLRSVARASSVSTVGFDRASTPSSNVSALTLVSHRRIAQPVPPAARTVSMNGNGVSTADPNVTIYENTSNGESNGTKRARAKFDYNANAPDELTLHAGDVLDVYNEDTVDGWSRGRKDGVDGFFPTSYAEPLDDHATEKIST